MARRLSRTVTVKKRAESAPIELRTGETTLGTLRALSAVDGQSATFSGLFTHSPAYADFSERFLALAAALNAGDADVAATLQHEIEAAGVHVYHLEHEMRIDRPASLRVVAGEVHFWPNDAYLMMRTGGLSG